MGCIQGARVVQEAVLERLDSENLMVHVVWTPVMPSDDRASVNDAQEIFSDPRVQQYWDADVSTGIAFKDFVELPPDNDTLAWDIYFVYEPGAEWKCDPPTPTDWWHQLAFDDRYLADGDGLRQALEDVSMP